jgi:hypothetical protein
MTMTKKKKANQTTCYSDSFYSTVNFPTKIHNISITATYNIFLDKVKYENYSIHPLVNGLPDHDAQIVTINSITVEKIY